MHSDCLLHDAWWSLSGCINVCDSVECITTPSFFWLPHEVQNCNVPLSIKLIQSAGICSV